MRRVGDLGTRDSGWRCSLEVRFVVQDAGFISSCSSADWRRVFDVGLYL